jgi:hypothetical protein
MPEPEVGLVGGNTKKTISTTEKIATTAFAVQPSQLGSLKDRFEGSTSEDRPLSIRRTAGKEKEIICRMILDPMTALKAKVEPR